jgi:hypothetical protein
MARRKRVVSERMIADIRVRFCYDAARKDVRVEPNDRDLASASLLCVLRLWVIIDRWTHELSTTHPGWTVNGERRDGAEDDDGEGSGEGQPEDTPGGSTGSNGPPAAPAFTLAPAAPRTARHARRPVAARKPAARTNPKRPRGGAHA